VGPHVLVASEPLEIALFKVEITVREADLGEVGRSQGDWLRGCHSSQAGRCDGVGRGVTVAAC